MKLLDFLPFYLTNPIVPNLTHSHGLSRDKPQVKMGRKLSCALALNYNNSSLVQYNYTLALCGYNLHYIINTAVSNYVIVEVILSPKLYKFTIHNEVYYQWQYALCIA